MEDGIPDLWNDISVDVLSPMSILKAQSQYLGKKTKGLVQLDVQIERDGEATVYNVYLLCPVLENERYLITSVYTGKKYYPVRITVNHHVLQDQQDFIVFLQNVFRSDDVRSILDSFFARINETKPELTKS